MSDQRKSILEAVKAVAPDLASLTETLLLGDIWKRDGLAVRDRSLISLSSIITAGRWEMLAEHFALARRNGLSDREISELLMHIAFYAGWPSALTAARVASDVLGIDLTSEAAAAQSSSE